MRQAFLLVGILFIAIFIPACSSNAATNTPGNNSGIAAANTADTNSADAPGITSTQPLTGDETNMASQGDVAMGNRRKLSNSADTGPLPPPQMLPAPDNSMVSTTMGKNGEFINTRIFKDNAQLLKIEKTYISATESRVKIWLKNGKVVTIPGEKMEKFNVIQTPDILALIGVKPLPTPVPPPPKINPEKLREQKENQ